MSRRAASIALAGAAIGAFAAPAAADFGLVKVSRTTAAPGALVSVTYVGYTNPWPRYPLYLVRASRAPGLVECQPHAICEPRVKRPPDGPPYTLLGRIRFRPSGKGTLRFRVPALRRGSYRFVFYCAPCYRGPGGSLIVERNIMFRVTG